MDDLATQPVERQGSSRLCPSVLLVDDEVALRSVVARQLQASGYRVIPAASGREALAILTQGAGTIDLLLTDVMMPDLNGPQLVAMVRHWWPAVRRLYMTGGADDSVLKLMRDSRTEWLQKPFTDDELHEALDAVLRNAGELATQ